MINLEFLDQLSDLPAALIELCTVKLETVLGTGLIELLNVTDETI